MGYPTSTLRTLRPELSTFEQLDREMQVRGYVGTRLMPAFPVGVASGTFSVIELKSLLANANADTRRTSTGGYNRGNYSWVERSYQTEEHGWEEPVDEREENMYANFFDLEEIAAYRAWEHLLNTLESRVLALIITATIAAGRTTAAGTAWSTFASATPIDNVFAAQNAVWARTGLWPRTLGCSRRAYRNLRRCAQIIDEVRSEGSGQSSAQKRVNDTILADVLDVDQIIVSDAILNTANIGQNASIASVFPDTSAVVAVTAKTNDFKEPCFGRVFHWGGDGSQLSDDQRLIGVVEDYEDPATRKRLIRARHETDEFVLYGECAQVITGVGP